MKRLIALLALSCALASPVVVSGESAHGVPIAKPWASQAQYNRLVKHTSPSALEKKLAAVESGTSTGNDTRDQIVAALAAKGYAVLRPAGATHSRVVKVGNPGK